MSIKKVEELKRWIIRNQSKFMRQIYAEALKHIVGGVNSPSRSYKAVGGGAPVEMARGKGAYLFDYLAAYGPIVTGHGHPHIAKAIAHAAETGVLFGTPD